MQPVACCPTDDPACEQVDDDGEVQPTFAGPDIGDVGAPLLVGPRCREVLIEQSALFAPSLSISIERGKYESMVCARRRLGWGDLSNHPGSHCPKLSVLKPRFRLSIRWNGQYQVAKTSVVARKLIALLLLPNI